MCLQISFSNWLKECYDFLNKYCYNPRTITICYINGMDQRILGRRIKFFRERAHLSQLELETSIDASAGMISRIEQGQVNPTKETVIKIGEVIDLNHMEVDYLIGVTFSPADEEEIKRAHNLVRAYLDRKDVIAYLADDRWRLLAVSKGFVRLLGTSQEIIDRIRGKSIIEVLLDDKLGITRFFDKDKYDELVNLQIRYFYDETSFMQDDEVIARTYHVIRSNKIASRVLDESPKQTSKTFYPKEFREVYFKVGPIKILTRYSREPIMRYSRFEIVEYSIVKKFPKLLMKAI